MKGEVHLLYVYDENGFAMDLKKIMINIKKFMNN